ncbi:MAG: hypothetical protein A2096_16830 [Spirochaetes bacterium GWF1_41_5]|nr:MAG: hypothetical protein A2096_16830 [Spirochaetes bacterium GWF1_41_5]HBE02436.1 hypothetical protein [Spirochaetia bacterium]
MTVSPKFRYFGKSDRGKRRHNEDYYEAHEIIHSVNSRKNRALLAVVCDGMGGANAGEVASRTAVKKIISFIKKKLLIKNSALYNEDINSIIQEAGRLAGNKILDMARDNPDYNGMGATCVITLVFKNQFFYAHAGDSRIYLISSGKIHALTRDHTLYNEMYSMGIRKDLPSRHIISRVLGVEENTDPEIGKKSPCGFSSGDCLLLCTDGLTGTLSSRAILKLNKIFPAPRDFTQACIEKALGGGAKDNITVLCVIK